MHTTKQDVSRVQTASPALSSSGAVAAMESKLWNRRIYCSRGWHFRRSLIEEWASLTEMIGKQLGGILWPRGWRMVCSRMTRLVEVMESDVAGKIGRWNSIVAWFADEHARGRIECEQIHRCSGS